MTSVGTTQLVSVLSSQSSAIEPPEPSSNVTNTAVEPLAYSELPRIFGRLADSQETPCAIVPSCMSSIRFGVMKEKAGSVLLARSVDSCVNGTSSAEQVDSEV